MWYVFPGIVLFSCSSCLQIMDVELNIINQAPDLLFSYYGENIQVLKISPAFTAYGKWHWKWRKTFPADKVKSYYFLAIIRSTTKKKKVRRRWIEGSPGIRDITSGKKKTITLHALFLEYFFYALCSTYEPASPEVPRTVTCNRNHRYDKGIRN